MLKDNWLIFENIDRLSEQLANDILALAQKSIKLNDNFKIVLTGGVSVVNVYKILRSSKSNWDKWHIYIGDERCLPSKSKDRNDNMINQVWLDDSPIPKQNVHFIFAELGVDNGAIDYEMTLKGVGFFDLVLLSMGEDGHVASLFPGHQYEKDKSVVVEKNSIKNPKERITLSYSRLNRSKNVFKIINGSSKKNTMQLLIAGQSFLPINRVTGEFERYFICTNAL